PRRAPRGLRRQLPAAPADPVAEVGCFRHGGRRAGSPEEVRLTDTERIDFDLSVPERRWGARRRCD
ncbi:hypothetical protein ACFWPO_17685, partial [Streptomyces sp. NPDC058476]